MVTCSRRDCPNFALLAGAHLCEGADGIAVDSEGDVRWFGRRLRVDVVLRHGGAGWLQEVVDAGRGGVELNRCLFADAKES